MTHDELKRRVMVRTIEGVRFANLYPLEVFEGDGFIIVKDVWEQYHFYFDLGRFEYAQPKESSDSDGVGLVGCICSFGDRIIHNFNDVMDYVQKNDILPRISQLEVNDTLLLT